MVAGDSLNIDKLGQMVDPMFEVSKRYEVPFILNPDNLQKRIDKIAGLSNWEVIKFNDPKEINKIPNDKKGVYAFIVKSNSSDLPSNSYVMYIGAAGVKSDNNLRSRYKNYLSNSSIESRPTIARLIYDWHEVLYFSFASVGSSVSETELEDFEIELNTLFAPPFSQNDIGGTIKKGRKAFP